MGQYDKYICTTLEKRHLLPPPTPEQRDRLVAMGRRIPMEHVHWIDEDVIPGAYYGETTWMWPPEHPHQVMWEQLAAEGYETPNMFPHAHGFPELLAWWGANPDDPTDIGPMGMQIADEIIPLESSWVAYVPADIPHMPVFHSGVRSQIHTRPTLHWTSGPGGVYTMGDDDKVGHAEQDEEEQAAPDGRMGRSRASRSTRGTSSSVPTRRSCGRLHASARPRVHSRPMAYVDQTIIPDAEFGCDTRWLLPGSTSKFGQVIMDAHTLPHGSTIACVAYNYDDLTDLCAEAELWIGGEKHVIDKGFWSYIPPDVSRGPLIVRNISRPVALIMSWPMGAGVEKYRGGR